jgi:hypothetical protein
VSTEYSTYDEFELLSDEARTESAPVAAEAAYRPRAAWRPGRCIGFIINSEKPVAKLKWSKGREAKEFLSRLAEGRL